MKLSAPIYRLRRDARLLSRDQKIPLYKALDSIAKKEGGASWSYLISKFDSNSAARKLLEIIEPGQLILLGARPGQGKTLLSLEVAAAAMKNRRTCSFFTLEYSLSDVRERFRDIGSNLTSFDRLFELDCSDDISADYIIQKLGTAEIGTLVVVDYLQLLDQRRENSPLSNQVEALKAFALSRGLTFLFLSQIDRSFNPSEASFPGKEHIRLPNPLNLKLFDWLCFLNEGSIRLESN